MSNTLQRPKEMWATCKVVHWPGQSGWRDAMLQKEKKKIYQDLKEENKNSISLFSS